MADYDEDGKLDLIVAQNNGLTKLFRNNKAKPGLRVRLARCKQNPYAISCLCIGFDWEEKSGYRKLKLSVPAKGKAGFTSMPITQIGVRFTNQVSSVALQNRSNLMKFE